MKKLQVILPSVIILAMISVLVYFVFLQKNDKELSSEDNSENNDDSSEENDITEQSITFLTAQDNTEYGKLVSKMNKEFQSNSSLSLDETLKCKLLVHAKGDIDFSVLHPLWIVQGPDYHYTIQFADITTAEKALQWLSKQSNIIYAEQDGIMSIN